MFIKILGIVIFFLIHSNLKTIIDLLVLAVLGLHCCTWAFSSCSEWRLSFVAAHRLLVIASLVAQHTGSRRASFSNCSIRAQ